MAAEFDRDRLKTLLPRLQARYQEVQAQEYLTQWRSDYEKLKAKRDGLAEELRTVYPEFETKITDLFTRIAANDADLSRLHQARPGGVALHLLGAELAARDLERFTNMAPSIAQELKLPTFAPPGARLAVAGCVMVDEMREEGQFRSVREATATRGAHEGEGVKPAGA